jgi:hypothetical protein
MSEPQAGGGLMQSIMGLLPQEMQTAAVQLMGGEAVQNLYSKLGTTQQGQMTEMLTTDPAFRAAMERAGQAGAEGGQNPLAGIPNGALNALVSEMHGDPAFRARMVAELNPAAPAGEQPAATAPDAATPQADNPFSSLMANNPGLQNMMSGMMNMFMASPIGQLLNGIFEMFMGTSMGESLRSLFGSNEVVAQSNNPAGVGEPGQVLMSQLHPSAVVNQVSPDNTVTPVQVADLGTRPEENPALRNPALDRQMGANMPSPSMV